MKGSQSLTVASDEAERSCVLCACIDRPHTASVCAIIVCCNTLGSVCGVDGVHVLMLMWYKHMWFDT